MKKLLLTAVAILLCANPALAAGPGRLAFHAPGLKAMTGSDIVVNNDAELAAAVVVGNSGKQICLNPGSYSAYKVEYKDFSPKITIRSCDVHNRAVVNGLLFDHASGVKVRFLAMLPWSYTRVCLQFYNGEDLEHDIDIDNNTCDGLDYTNGAFDIHGGHNLTITNNDITNTSTAQGIFNFRNAYVGSNHVHDIEGDAFDVYQSSFIWHDRNHVENLITIEKTGCHPPTDFSLCDHFDAFQVSNSSSTEANNSHDLTFTRNIARRGLGAERARLSQFQGIFVGNEASLDYIRFTISYNEIYGGNQNGISCGQCNGGIVTYNKVQGYDGQGSGIVLDRVTNTLMTNNISTLYLVQNPPNTGTFSPNTDISYIPAP